ncbi:DEAD/DEAH box helicase [Eggerthia catenaformis]|nr:DEAD/DEAH box helicase [Eggerthia catenaformis]
MHFSPYPYQERSIDFIVEHPKCALLLDMGLGKTVCTLSAISMLKLIDVSRILVIAPVRVARSTWPSEIEKWDETAGLTYSVVVGTPRQRLAALQKPADIYIINRENVIWLTENAEFSFDMVVIDELSSFKNRKSKRFRALRKHIHRCHRVVGLTGTPAPNGLMDLWPQMYLLDQGARLGKTITRYREKWFRPGRSNGYVVYDYIPRPEADTQIYEALSDITISMRKEDYLVMPERSYIDISVSLQPDVMKVYRKFEKDAVLELEPDEIAGINAAAVANKLQQFADGAVYNDDGEAVHIHDSKLDALEDLVESANGQSVIVFYAFRHEKKAIESRFDVREINTQEDVDDWNEGRIPMLVAHPASIGHGLNLQKGGHIIIWYGLTWSLELYQQANDRLYRQGQEHPVMIYHLVSEGTIDERILKVIRSKGNRQDELIDYMKEIRNEKYNA